MRIGIFEDAGVDLLEPITLTRPAFALRSGASTLLERHRRFFDADDLGAWMRPALAELTRLEYPGLAVNQNHWQADIWTNARWLPASPQRLDATTPHVGMVGQEVAYVAAPPVSPAQHSGDIGSWLALCKQRLPQAPAEGVLIDYLWDAIDHNGDALRRDWAWFQAMHGPCFPPYCAVVGPTAQLVVAADAQIEPHVTADTRKGPILIDRGAVIQSFSRLEGPCYVGPESWILGARLRGGSSIGPRCRIGGEVEASIVLGNSNKYHDGFLGHSYLGEWVNLAAATQTSDLRNDYGPVHVVIGGQRVATGRTKIGSYIGDHAKTGLGALLNTGSVVGAFCSVLPSGTLLPTVVPSFCQVHYGALQECADLRQLFDTAATMMQRRVQELTETHRDFYYRLFDQTADYRRNTLRAAEIRRLRRSI